MKWWLNTFAAWLARQPNTERYTFLGALITEYGNCCFDCGAWDGDDGEEYAKLNDKAVAAKEALLQEIARIRRAIRSRGEK